MDSSYLERERGITICNNTAFITDISLLLTPGHSALG